MDFASRSLFALTLLSSSWLVTGCATDDATARPADEGVREEQEGTEPETTPAAEAPLLSDNEIAGIVAAIHEGEISHARIARERARTAEVRGYADKMIEDHTRALDQLDALRERAQVIPQPSTLQQELTTDALNVEQDLAARDPVDFDRVYMTGQVAMHQRAIDIADRQLTPAVQSADLRAYLQRVRPVLVEHLEIAQRISRAHSVAAR